MNKSGLYLLLFILIYIYQEKYEYQSGVELEYRVQADCILICFFKLCCSFNRLKYDSVYKTTENRLKVWFLRCLLQWLQKVFGHI